MSQTTAESDKNKTWHATDVDSVISELAGNTEGLSEKEAQDRLQQYGPNSLPEAAKQPAWLRFLLQFHNVLIYILIAAAVVTALMQHWIDTFVILGVVVINSIIGFIQEGKAERALEGIRKMLSLNARVKRAGKTHSVDAKDLVPGDIVLLESGDKIPADLRLIKVRNLKVEESPLTGESVPVDKNTDVLEKHVPLGDRFNMAFSGTMVTSGRATGIVVATGGQTELGKINEMMNAVQSLKTPLLQQMDRFGKMLSIVIGALTALFFFIGFVFHDYPTEELLLAVIGLAVAAIPEGLPAIMTITLALGVQQMARQKAIIRRLPSVETLGSVTVICSDKTGTLTRNEMTVQKLLVGEHTFKVTGTGYAPEGEIQDDTGNAVKADDIDGLRQLIQCAHTCNDADLNEKDGEWVLQGDPTEGGLLTLARKAGEAFAEPHKRIDTLPFESDYKYMATLNADAEGRKTIWVKGAPERLLDRCSQAWHADGNQAIDKEVWKKRIEEMASKGLRVLAAAYRPLAEGDSTETIDHASIEEDLILLGLYGMIDPPRPEAIEAVEACKAAGIRVKMITGDHALTASAIARELGLEAWENPLTGLDLDEMEPEALADAAIKCDVFARTSPENKLRLVEALQSRGEITAMTGDGVNDAPALKRSDVGIAMGLKGTEVTKDASEMVLADDNFATIARAVREGRTIYDNLRKAILFILPTNGAQGLVVMAAIMVGMAMPITPVQILWINMVTAVTLALALSFEPSETGVMKRPPRNPKASILDSRFVLRLGIVSILLAGFSIGFFQLMLHSGASSALASTVAVNTLAIGQAFYLFNCRSLHDSAWLHGFFSNRIAWLTVGLLLLLQALFTYNGWMQSLFGTESMPLHLWPKILLAGLVVFIIVEAEKAILAARRNGR
jgi:magnesium-transporting ATPase (P-type)